MSREGDRGRGSGMMRRWKGDGGDWRTEGRSSVEVDWGRVGTYQRCSGEDHGG